ncbi:MAG: hypothetical protein ACOCVS_01950 [Planctomycetota bacterium]
MPTSRKLVRAPNPQQAIGQLGGHVKRGLETPHGKRTGMPMALVSAVPLEPGSDRMVVSFIDRSAPVETRDNLPHLGDNAVLVVPAEALSLSLIKGVNPGDWRGAKLAYGETMEEPVDLDVDPTGLDVEASDAWVDLVDEIGCDCTKCGGYPLWANAPIDVEALTGRKLDFHHRIAGDLIDLALADGGVVYVFVDRDGSGGALCWQSAGGGAEQTYSMWE